MKNTISNMIAVNVDDLVPRPGETPKPGDPLNLSQDLGAVANLPKVTAEEAIAVTIQTILGWATILTIIAVVIAGIYYIMSRGKEEELTKSKDIVLYLVIGMAIMASAYAIITGLLKFEFFK